MNLLQHKTIIITGASKGIGKATALAFSKWQTKLALIARSKDELITLQQSVIANGSQCLIYAGDVSDEVFVNTSTSDILKHFGNTDILINNAGFGIFKKAEETDQGNATVIVVVLLVLATVIPMVTYFWYQGFS